jgi:hypothetical protein
MADFKYYFSRDPITPSATNAELLSIEADSPADAIEQIRKRNTAPTDWASLWVHLLVWSSNDGKQHGFQSTRLR